MCLVTDTPPKGLTCDTKLGGRGINASNLLRAEEVTQQGKCSLCSSRAGDQISSSCIKGQGGSTQLEPEQGLDAGGSKCLTGQPARVTGSERELCPTTSDEEQ